MSRAALAPRAARALLGAAGLALPAAAPALADRVSVKGVVLEGRVESITAERVVMSTVYGKGQLAIAVADVEAIETDDP
jgi:hypothetical protein